MAMPEDTYDPLAGSRWLQSLTPVRTRTDGDGGDGRPRVHNFHGMTPALAARAYERVLNRADLESHAREQIPVATAIDDPMPPQTTPARPPEQEMPPAPTQAAPTVPAPVPPSAPTPPDDRDSADEDIQHLMATPHNPPAPTTSVPSTAVPSSALPVQPEVTPSAVTQDERDPLLDANGPNSDPLPMPSTSGREAGKPWIEERPGGSTVEYTIPEGNGHNTVDAVVRDAEGNVVSRARIVRVEGTGTYRRWQDDVGGGASYYESGDSDTVGYGQHFAPGSSTSGPPTSEFEASPDLTRVRTASYDDNGRLVGVDVGSKNSIGLYDNVHSDLFDNRTFSSASFSPSGGLVSTFTGQIDSLGNGWVADSDGERWEVYPDDNGNLVQRRINHDTNGYEFKYSAGGVGVHELRDKSGRLLALSQFDADGELIKNQIRVGGQLATGFPDGDGQVEFRFTDRSLIGSSMFVMPWEDRPGPRAGRVISTPDGIRISYGDGEVLQFGHDGGLTSHRASVDSRALWKRAVSFAGGYYYGLGSGAVGTVEGIGALTGFNDSINSVVALTGSGFRLSSREDAVKGLFHAIGEIGVTAFNAYKTLGAEGAGHIFGDRSWSDSWRNIRRATGANWNATSKFFIGTDWEGASHHLPETLGQAAFGTAMFFVPVRALGALGKGGGSKLGDGTYKSSRDGSRVTSRMSPPDTGTRSRPFSQILVRVDARFKYLENFFGNAWTRYIGSGSARPALQFSGTSVGRFGNFETAAGTRFYANSGSIGSRSISSGPVHSGAASRPRVGMVHRIDFELGKTRKTRNKASEFERQIAGQVDGINRMTANELLENQRTVVRKGQAQRVANRMYRQAILREEKLKAYGLQSVDPAALKGKTVERYAEERTQERTQGLAALHEPDIVAGGRDVIALDASGLPRMGDGYVNSSIGSQWKGVRVAELTRYAEDLVRAGFGDHLLNVEWSLSR